MESALGGSDGSPAEPALSSHGWMAYLLRSLPLVVAEA